MQCIIHGQLSGAHHSNSDTRLLAICIALELERHWSQPLVFPPRTDLQSAPRSLAELSPRLTLQNPAIKMTPKPAPVRVVPLLAYNTERDVLVRRAGAEHEELGIVVAWDAFTVV